GRKRVVCLSVREFVDLAFSQAGLDYRNHVVTDPTLFRPAEVNLLLGDATKARMKLGWTPSITFESLVREMVDADCRALGAAHEPPQSQAGGHAYLRRRACGSRR